eukprot:1254910-Amphidinium_carterae.1
MASNLALSLSASSAHPFVSPLYPLSYRILVAISCSITGILSPGCWVVVKPMGGKGGEESLKTALATQLVPILEEPMRSSVA